MANIDKELNKIKNAVYGREVRGSIHDGIDKINKETEIATGKADEAHDVMESIINDGFDNAALESNFEQKLDDKINNLQPEWTQFKEQTNQQLADTESEVTKKIAREKTSHKSLYNNLGSDTDENIIINKHGSEERYSVLINHEGDSYQSWRLTNENYVFDGNFPTHEKGDPFLSDIINYQRLYKTKDVQHYDNEVIKEGSWETSGTNTFSGSAGDYLELTFYGSSLRLTYLESPSAGIARIEIDGSAENVNGLEHVNGEALLDMYDATGGNKSVWVATGLTNKWHTLRIYVTGDKHQDATNNRLYIRYLRYEYPPFTNNDMSVQGLSATNIQLNSGAIYFRQGTSAIELAILNTLNDNTVWSGSVHRNAYPLSDPELLLDGQKIEIKGNEWVYGKELIMIQNIMLINGNTDIAELELIHKYNKNGLQVIWELNWLVDVTINNSYAGMYGTSVNKIKFGGSSETFNMINNDSVIGDEFTDHAIGWHENDDYAVILELLDYENTVNDYKDYKNGMFVSDRIKDAKLYAPKYKGSVSVGDKWKSSFKVGIKHQNLINKIIN